MTDFIKPLLRPRFLLLYSAILALFLFTRLFNLTLIPVFVDEAIYIRWSQVMKAEPTLRFLPLSDGKQPLFMWLMIPMFKLFKDPLVAGRIPSILAGFGTLLGLSALVWYLSKSKKAIIIVSLLYILTPFTLFFDRMALADSLLSMLAIWSAFIGILFVKNPRLDLAMILGVILGSAVLTKSPGWYFLMMQPLFLLALPKLGLKKLPQIMGGWLIAAGIAFAMYNILRLGPNFHMIALRNKDYVFSFAEVLKHPLNPFIGHFTDSIEWLVSLLTIPAIIALLLSIIFGKNHFILPLFLWALAPFLFQASIAKAYTSRYFLFVAPPLLAIIAMTLNNLPKKLFTILALLILVFTGYKSFLLLTNPPSSPIPQNMKYGYFQEWTAGYGQKEVAEYLKERSRERNIVVGTEGYFGTLPDGLQIYTQGYGNIIVLGIGQPVFQIPDSLKEAYRENEVYLVVNRSRNKLLPIDLQNHVELIAEYEKPIRPDGTREALQFYRLKNISLSSSIN